MVCGPLGAVSRLLLFGWTDVTSEEELPPVLLVCYRSALWDILGLSGEFTALDL
jgi:hypothetical protein